MSDSRSIREPAISIRDASSSQSATREFSLKRMNSTPFDQRTIQKVRTQMIDEQELERLRSLERDPDMEQLLDDSYTPEMAEAERLYWEQEEMKLEEKLGQF